MSKQNKKLLSEIQNGFKQVDEVSPTLPRLARNFHTGLGPSRRVSYSSPEEAWAFCPLVGLDESQGSKGPVCKRHPSELYWTPSLLLVSLPWTSCQVGSEAR